MVLLIAAFVMGFIDSTCKANQGLMYLYRLMPGFALGNGLIQLTMMDQLQATYTDCGRMTLAQQITAKYTPYSWIVAGSNLTYMALEIVVYFSLAVAIDVMLSYPSIRARLIPDKDVKDPPYEVRSGCLVPPSSFCVPVVSLAGGC